MFKLSLLISMLFGVSSLAHAKPYGTCVISNGKMIGSIHTDSSIWLSGNVIFTLYDKNFHTLYTYKTRKSGSVSSGVHQIADERISTADLKRAASCSFNVADAVGDPEPPQSYSEFCSLRNGEAVGFVKYTSGLSYSGKVYFTVYDSKDKVLDTYDTRKSGVNGGSGTIEVASYRLSSSDYAKAKTCSFDMSDAIRD